MSLRSIARLVTAAVAAVALAIPAARANAQPITYSFKANLPFAGNALVDFQFGSDVSSVLNLTGPLSLPTGTSAYLTFPSSANATVNGSAAFPLDAIFGAGSSYLVGSVNGVAAFGLPFDNGVGFLALGTGGTQFGLFMPVVAPYDLSTNYGPVTGPALAFVGPTGGAIDPRNIFVIDHATFQATVTATPEPASIALMATGLVGIVGVARRRRRAVTA